MANQGGSHEQHLKAGQQNQRNSDRKQASSLNNDQTFSGTRAPAATTSIDRRLLTSGSMSYRSATTPCRALSTAPAPDAQAAKRSDERGASLRQGQTFASPMPDFSRGLCGLAVAYDLAMLQSVGHSRPAAFWTRSSIGGGSQKRHGHQEQWRPPSIL